MSPHPCRLRGLYALTDAALLPEGRLVWAVEAALEGGATMIQYRDKGTNRGRRRRQVEALLEVCRAHGAPLLVNDDVELAAETGADGVHLGREDAPLEAARARLGPGALIGVSCYDALERAHTAQAAGADYVAFGSFFPSATKPHAVHAELALLRTARAQLRLPIAAIGGISTDNARAVVEAGADMVAVIRGVFGATDIRAAARAYAEIFDPGQ